MEEIKSVRVRVSDSSSTDFKLTLFRVNNTKRKVIVYPENNLPEMDFGFRWRNYLDGPGYYSIIDEYLSMMVKLGNLSSDYKIIQDPWLEKVPKKRSFGFDTYYLNNGSMLFIDWLENDYSVGGDKWSDDSGNELEETLGGDDKYTIIKNVRIIPSSDDQDDPVLTFNNLHEIVPNAWDATKADFTGVTLDKYIIDFVIQYWKKQVPNYDLELCDPDNEFCNIIEYKSPLVKEDLPDEKEDNVTPVEENDTTPPKEKLSVVIPSDVKVKIKEDISIKIYVGDPPKNPNLDGFDFGDEFDDLDLLDEEYQEGEFEGQEETTQEALNSIEEIAEIEQSFSNVSTVPIQSTGEYTSSLPEETNDSNYKKNKVPYYNQYDPRWNKVIYGLSQEKQFIEAEITPEVKGKLVNVSYNGSSYKIKCDHKGGNSGFSSIAGGGCGVTSLAMVVNYWAIKNNLPIYTSPIKMAKLACESGARPGPPCNGTNMYNLAKGFNSKGFGLELKSINASSAESYVKKGYPVIWGCKKGKAKNSGGTYKSYGGHFMVISEYRDGKFYINDPGNYSSKGCLYTEKFSDISSGSSYFFVAMPNNQLA